MHILANLSNKGRSGRPHIGHHPLDRGGCGQQGLCGRHWAGPTVTHSSSFNYMAIGSNINQCIVKHLTCTSWYRGNCHIILVFSIAAAAWCDHLIPRLWLAPRSGIASSARRPLSCCRPRLWPWSKDVAMYHCWSIHLFNWVQHLTFSLSSHRVRGQWVGYIGTAEFSVLPNTFGRDEVTIAPTIEDVTL